uniref:F-box domain-containing protein n=1 Tax=Setaria viridis TaxID=4556 RepID=A0A4U6WHI2_SETVI|nr:hypothetical protein SEVIR_1G368000v2 [Setaria viridis]
MWQLVTLNTVSPSSSREMVLEMHPRNLSLGALTTRSSKDSPLKRWRNGARYSRRGPFSTVTRRIITSGIGFMECATETARVLMVDEVILTWAKPVHSSSTSVPRARQPAGTPWRASSETLTPQSDSVSRCGKRSAAAVEGRTQEPTLRTRNVRAKRSGGGSGKGVQAGQPRVDPEHLEAVEGWRAEPVLIGGGVAGDRDGSEPEAAGVARVDREDVGDEAQDEDAGGGGAAVEEPVVEVERGGPPDVAPESVWKFYDPSSSTILTRMRIVQAPGNYSVEDSIVLVVHHLVFPQKRTDGWMELKLGEFHVQDCDTAGEVCMNLMETKGELLMKVLSYITPQDAGCVAAVSQAFRAIVDSDTSWSCFVPDVHDLPRLAYVDDMDYSIQRTLSKKEMFLCLSDRPILLADHRMSMWLDRQTGSKCYMLSARALNIARGNTPKHWRWIHLTDCRLDFSVLEASVRIGKCKSTREVCLHGDGDMHPQQRADGWKEVEMGEFYNKEGNDGEVSISLSETTELHNKKGLIVYGIEIRPRK